MTSTASQLRFAAELATFVVAVAGAAVVLLRPQLLGVRPRPRVLLGLGFLAVAVAAFLYGSLLAEARDLPVVFGRSAGIVLLGLGTLGWGEDRSTRRIVWVALVLMVGAEAAALGDSVTAAEAIQLLSAVGLGAVLYTSARRSIPARIAITAAATLLVVVLAVSVTLSSLISDNVEREALRRVDSRTQVEVQEVGGTAVDQAVYSAKLTALSLQGGRGTLLQALAQNPGPNSTVEGDVDALSVLLPKGAMGSPLLYATMARAVIVTRNVGNRALAEVLVGSRPVTQALDRGARWHLGDPDPSASSLQVIGSRALAVGAYPVRASLEGPVVGVVVATQPLDDGFLAGREAIDRNVSLALVDRDRPLAVAGRRLPPATMIRLAQDALGSRDQVSRVAAGSFLAARAVRGGDGSKVLAVVTSTPTSIVDAPRTSLFRRLFLVSLVTALVAFVASILLGERIGVGLRRLTRAAGDIQRGDLSTRAAVVSPDELGVLGSAFDQMAGSIETLAGELRQTAGEEAQVRNRLEAVVAGMGEALVAVDASGGITIFNHAAEELFGVPRDQALARSVTQVGFMTTEEGADLSERLARPSREAWQLAATVLRADGVEVPVALSAGALMGANGALAGGVYVLRDMRREREAERTKSEFLSNISHELRTPLVPIKGYALMLRSGRMGANETNRALAEMVESADKLAKLVDRLLDVAGEGRGTRIRREPVDVRPMVEAVVKRWRERKDLAHPVTRRIARGLPELVGDRRLLERCVDELVDNAVKYSPGGGRVLVAARPSDDWPVPAVEISVEDHGIGIPPERREAIFEDFSQADSSATRAFGGLGLGLGFVRRIVEAHGGELRCESEPDRGSRFSMILPVAPAAPGGGARP